jgi:predicted DNA repair protein MutK
MKVKMPCGGTVNNVTKSLLEQGGTFLCSKGCEHTAEEIKKVLEQKGSKDKKQKGGD